MGGFVLSVTRSATGTDSWHLGTHDDVVYPGKRFESRINVCSFCRVIRRKGCQWRTCVAHTGSRVQPPTTGSIATTRRDQKDSWIAAAVHTVARMQRLSRFENTILVLRTEHPFWGTPKSSSTRGSHASVVATHTSHVELQSLS